MAAGLGLGGVGFFGTVMDRYQPYFMVASLGLMTFWILRLVKRSGGSGDGVRTVIGAVARPITVMGVAWAATLAVAAVAARVAGLA